MKLNILKSSATRRYEWDENSFSYPAVCDVTEESIQMWADLPDEIRMDPSLSSFRQEYERINGISRTDGLTSEQSNVENLQIVNRESIELGIINENDVSFDKAQQNGQNKLTAASGSHHMNKPNHEIDENPKPLYKILNNIKIIILVAVWILFTGILMLKDEKMLIFHQLAIPVNESKSFILDEMPVDHRLRIVVEGAFMDEKSNSTNFLYAHLRLQTPFDDNHNSISTTNIDDNVFKIPIIHNIRHLDRAVRMKKSHMFYLDADSLKKFRQNGTVLHLQIETNLPISFPIDLAYDPTPIDTSSGVIYAGIILLGLYIMIIFELVDRTFAAIVASTLSIAILSLMSDERPTMPEILSWIDVETLLLLFGMMTIVGILSETGLFDYLAVFAFKITNGRTWPLINCLCLFTAFLSALLDNVTTLLLMGPVSIRLCEVLQLNPVPILVSMIVFSNIGGAMTPVGDPPNIIIASNSHVVRDGVDFLTFSTHMSLGIIFVMIQSYLQLRLKFRNISVLRLSEPQDVQNLRKEIANWQTAASSLISYSKDESILHIALQNKINHLQYQLQEKLSTGSIPKDTYEQTLLDLQEKYPIRDRVLLIKSMAVMAFVLCFFFFHSMPYIERLSLGWTALLGTILLLILVDRRDIEPIMARVEWTTLLFFAVLFVLMESLAKLGLIDFIGNQTEAIILSVDEGYRLAVAIIIILWVSAIASAFVDNIPLTTMMIKVTISLTQKEALNMPLQPLVWALAFGACLGGNGTLIGASANIVAAGVAQQHGYQISFGQYFKVGFPSMLGSLVVATIYLLICHVLFSWH